MNKLWVRLKVRVFGSVARFVIKRPQTLRWGLRMLAPFAARRLRRALAPTAAQSRKVDGAIQTLQNYISQDSQWEDQLALAQLLVGRRKYAEASALFEQVAADPTIEIHAKAEAQLWFARSLEYAGRLSEARIAYVRYLAESPSVGTLERRRIERRIADL